MEDYIDNIIENVIEQLDPTEMDNEENVVDKVIDVIVQMDPTGTVKWFKDIDLLNLDGFKQACGPQYDPKTKTIVDTCPEAEEEQEQTEWEKENKSWYDPLIFLLGLRKADPLVAARKVVDFLLQKKIKGDQHQLALEFLRNDKERKKQLQLLKFNRPYLWAQLIEQEQFGGIKSGSKYSVRHSSEKMPYLYMSGAPSVPNGPSAAWEWSMCQKDPNYFQKYCSNLPSLGSLDPEKRIKIKKRRRK